MRAAAVLFLPALAALALVGVLELTTGGAKPVEAQSFVWKKRAFTSKREFSAWLERRNVSYADWAARHPGASPPWKEERSSGSSGDDEGLGALHLLAAALAGIAVLLVFTRAPAGRFARRARRSLLARLRAEETYRPVVAASRAGPLRNALSVYGLRPLRVDEPAQPARPELVLVEAPPAESRAIVDPKPDAAAVELPQRAAVAAEREPETGVEAPPRPRRRPVRTAEQITVDTQPHMDAAAAAEPARRELEPEPEPEPGASASEPEPVVGGRAPRRRGRGTRRGQKSAVQTTRSVEPAEVEEPVTPEPAARPAASADIPAAEVEPIDHMPMPAPAPAPPPLPNREVFCEVAFWRGYVKGQFYAHIWGDDGMSTIATSPMFRCRSSTPEQTDECLEALAALHDLLVAEGWEPVAPGRAWYARRFMNHVPA